MRIGIGIPNSIPGGDGKLLLEWARRADRLGFSTLATTGRVAYPSYGELIVLSAAGREGSPEFRVLSYFALGERAASGRDYLIDYYGPFAERIWPSTPRDRAALAELVRSFEAAGADELIFSSTIASLDRWSCWRRPSCRPSREREWLQVLAVQPVHERLHHAVVVEQGIGGGQRTLALEPEVVVPALDRRLPP